MPSRFAVLVALLAAPAFAAGPDKPKLVVLVVFDQMRGDYLTKWRPLFGTDGFVRMQTEGAWYVNCHYPYATTATGPGHASMLTGTCPDVHGIIHNVWYDRAGAVVNCAQSDRYQRIPPVPKPAKAGLDEKKEDSILRKEKPAPGTPERLLAPTFGDALKEATKGQGKVVGLSYKDRSALLPVGAKANAAYWFDNADGTVVTSSFYRDAVHPWVAAFNASRMADRWFDLPWEHVRKDLDYVKYSGPDDAAGEGKGSKQGVTFPHPMDGGLKAVGKAYYEALYNSPFGNVLLLALAKEAIIAEKLGQHREPDLLSVSFSSNDVVGHTWGPDSQEVLDVTLRSDRLLADLLKFLDDAVGKGKYIVCLTADHGICPLPEQAARHGVDAKRVSIKAMAIAAEAFLRETYDDPREVPTKWIEAVTFPWMYLNEKAVEAHGLKPSAIARTLANFLARQDGVFRTFTRADLAIEPDPYDAIGRRMRRSYFPARSGDVALLLRPYWLASEENLTGTSHGTPFDYDTHVPLLVFGPNVKPGVRKEEVTPQAIAAIFARALGIPPPAKAEFPVPDGLFEKE